ncbi:MULTISPECIES: M20 family metallo-hydrolase [unclassified Brenneria]|uniref:M20 family metallo-hydrolase n=1 Tax=unclassified Brenneria TaxID=2634434 RepID=UPI001555D165|nr:MULTISPECIES: M20 family metallo-hydrolase [unclassified Brenneria]MBJ7222156.1 M20 family metallo-hydrolase [Brenneria sp. L3-3C-1]MEE3643399.1 M20 family metallo-hydrolase [Brenneria sp. L3_3C_1]MEE3651584.1 M20 family metallo-hydrolase [Brenneria sp. HEZEL_4_2_4]NPD01541.1 M20 family metallo-hydrolase [Brenneria sp. hezel4-2-4]
MISKQAKKAADCVRQSRLLDNLAILSRFGALASGGVDRQALSTEDLDARAWLIDLAQSLGCEVSTDDCANLFIRRAGQQDLPPVVTGSHIDTQPCGGNLDGCYGVMAGIECLSALNEAGIVTQRPLEVVVWTNEEGSRFAPGAMGSSAFVNPDLLAGYLENRDRDGVTVGTALADCHRRFASLPRRAAYPMAAFIELHIEQGPVLEQAGLPLATVQGIQGVRWYQIRCLGQSAHAGTTPMDRRKDAMTLARRLADRIEQSVAAVPIDRRRLTFGSWQVTPNAINTVASEVSFTVDFRHPDDAVLDRFDAAIAALAADDVTVTSLLFQAPVAFDPHLLAQQQACCEVLDIPTGQLVSGAFHDAMYLARHCPTSMFFVPSRNGISHNPAEYTDPHSLWLGARALACCLTALANPLTGVNS